MVFLAYLSRFVRYHEIIRCLGFIPMLVFMLTAWGCAGPGISKDAGDSLENGLEFAKDHDWNRALVEFAKATQEQPMSALAWANHGTALLNTGKAEQAIKSYEKAKSLNKDDPYIYCSLGSACQALGRFEEALTHLDDALATDPAYAPAMANKARALEKLGRPREAAVYYQKAFELDPKLRRHFSTSEENND